ncbi:MAG: riboflavin synthase [Candidatus Omnitrophota bacterium]
MFTGIIQEIGCVKYISRKGSLTRFDIESGIFSKDCSVSDSVSVNGVCLTIVENKSKVVFFDAVKPTLDTTNLKRLTIGCFVNLEVSLKVGDKLGGHFVLGHVDCELRLKRKNKQNNYFSLEIDLPAPYRKYIIEKGSVAIDGISLTVKKIYPKSFSLDVTPYTYGHTNLKYKRTGDYLNAEFDYLLKAQAQGSLFK